MINVSDSATPPGVYWVHWNRQFKRGDLVLFREPLKRLVGFPGDTVIWASDGVRVNGRLLPGSAIPLKSPYPPFPYQTLRLREGQYLAMGNSPLSFDSRYQGPLPESLIHAEVEPVWLY